MLETAKHIATEYNLEFCEVQDTPKVRVYSFKDETSYLYVTYINNTNNLEVLYNNELKYTGNLD